MDWISLDLVEFDVGCVDYSTERNKGKVIFVYDVKHVIEHLIV
jgi:hypothetical protein